MSLYIDPLKGRVVEVNGMFRDMERMNIYDTDRIAITGGDEDEVFVDVEGDPTRVGIRIPSEIFTDFLQESGQLPVA